MDHQHFSDFLLIGLAALLGAISPGPDFLIVVRNSLVYSRQKGFLTSVGVALALIIHLSYTLASISLLVEFSHLFQFIKYIGAFYLFYIGFNGLRSSFKKQDAEITLNGYSKPLKISSWTALRQGFLTNLLNPASALFFISLFSQFIEPDTHISLRLEYAVLTWTISLGWLLFLTYLITGKIFESKIEGFRLHIDRLMGSFLMLVGLKMLFV